MQQRRGAPDCRVADPQQRHGNEQQGAVHDVARVEPVGVVSSIEPHTYNGQHAEDRGGACARGIRGIGDAAAMRSPSANSSRTLIAPTGTESPSALVSPCIAK
jgi:hypothetical protein